MKKVNSILKSIMQWVSPEAPPSVPYTVEVALAMTERNKFSSLFTYRVFDDENKLCYLEDGDTPALGFALETSALVVAGLDAEQQIEAAINACPPDTVLLFGKLSTPQVEGYLNLWTRGRIDQNANELLRNMALSRRKFMLESATGPSLLPDSKLHPRMTQCYVTVRVPFSGDVTNATEVEMFLRQVKDLRGTVQGALSATGIHSTPMDEASFKTLLRQLANPHLEPKAQILDAHPGLPLSEDIVSPNTRVTLTDENRIGFAGGPGGPEVVVTALTADAMPRPLMLPKMAETLGDPRQREDRITAPYWAYTIVHVLHADKARDQLMGKFAALNKQTMSESPWFRSMMSHLYERRDMVQALLKEGGKGHTLVRAYTGINVYSAPEEARSHAELVKGLWRRAGFRLTEEKYIALPVFMASMPMQYTPTMDPPNRGLQRAQLMSSLNAATLVQVQGDWRGNEPSTGGPLMISRSGQLAAFNLLASSTNYNFVVVATSGSGKSFFTQELVGDFLSKAGMVRLIDVGRSYYRFCERIGGQNIVFDAENPVSLNPFTGIRTADQLNEMLPMLKDLLRLMAYPLTPEAETPAFQYQLIEEAITEAWRAYNENAELAHVCEWLEDHSSRTGDTRSGDLALQLKAYATGRYRRWFSGPRSISFDRPFVVVELEELKKDTNLQAVVLQLVMYQVTNEMYLSDRRIPKMMAIDEAWDLMGGMKTGRFIETLFRRARKYNGIAGVITQSFEDFEKSEASRAAIENAAWQFVLRQRPESLEFAVANKRVVSDDYALDLMRSVKSGNGYSEVFVRSEEGYGLYRFVTDRHTYYTFTTKPADINRITNLMESGKTLAEAIDELAQADYMKMWGHKIDLSIGQ